VIGWMTTRPNHPMATLRAARQVLADLPQVDALRGLAEVGEWVDSVTCAEGLSVRHRLDLCALLDDAARPYLTRLAREFLLHQGRNSAREEQLWSAISRYWWRLGEGYRMTLQELDAALGSRERTAVRAALARALRAVAQQIKWLMMRHQGVEPGYWGHLAEIYRRAESLGVAAENARILPGPQGTTTCDRELLKILGLAIGAADGLASVELEIADRVTTLAAPRFRLSREADQALIHCFDRRGGTPPRRVSPYFVELSHLLYFSTAEALPALEKLLARSAARDLPPELRLGFGDDAFLVGKVAGHLARNWAPTPPVRRHARHRVMTPISVLVGFERLLYALHGLGDNALTRAETWIAEDISARGLSAVAQMEDRARVRVGGVIGVRPEGKQGWSVGLVRRLVSDADGRSALGVQIFGHVSAPVLLRPFAFQGGGSDGPGEHGVCLARDEMPDEVLLLMRRGRFSMRQRLEAEFFGGDYYFVPLALVESGDDFDLGRYRTMDRTEMTHTGVSGWAGIGR
jgi:hypothetical protein